MRVRLQSHKSLICAYVAHLLRQCRPKASKGRSRLGMPLTPIPEGGVSYRKRIEDDTEYIHIDLDEELVAR